MKYQRDTYDEMLETLRDELAALEKQRTKLKEKYQTELDEVESRITKIKTSIVSISRLLDVKKVAYIMHDIANAPAGLTDAIREVLKASANPLSPTEIREGLDAIGYDIAQHNNVMASIHTCLKRLLVRMEVVRGKVGRKMKYEWKR